MKIGKIALLLLVWVSSGFTQDIDPKVAAAKEFVALFEMEKSYDNVFAQIAQNETLMFEEEFADVEIPEEVLASMQEANQKSAEVIQKKFPWKRMEAMFVEIYTDVFTLEELQGLVDFYKTPAGQKFISKQTELSMATMQKMRQFMTEIMPEIKKELAPYKEKLKEKMEKLEQSAGAK